MITVKDAAKIALGYVTDLIGSENVLEPLIEEVDQSDDGQYWLVTVGFDRPLGTGARQFRLRSERRDYKQVRIQMADGQVRSMRMRTV
ncbi:MAG TPA: hypothetical protein VFC78_16490 [Tepidisphaeraceae bacterium]|nr:hypothetical protein [Tepidisphaeraceae bacterium]